MAVPAAYTNATFVAYLHSVLGGVASILSLSLAANSYDEIVNDTLLALGQNDITTIADIRGLRATGRYYAWKRAADEAATLYDFAVDKRSFKRSQIASLIMANLAAAENDPHVVIGSDDANTITLIPLNYTDDPYSNKRSSSFHRRPYDE